VEDHVTDHVTEPPRIILGSPILSSTDSDNDPIDVDNPQDAESTQDSYIEPAEPQDADSERAQEQDSDLESIESSLRRSLPVRSTRGQKPQRYGFSAQELPALTEFAFAAGFETPYEPQYHTPSNLQEALAAPDAHEWKRAMDEEVQALQKMETWRLVELPLGRKAMPGKWLYKLKTDVNGRPIRYKARWCARGDRQRYGIDYMETYAAVARSTSFRICMAICAKHDLYCHQMDVTTAFLNGNIEPGLDVYTVQPYGYEQGNHVCLLQKALYGLKQSARLWYERFTQYICDILGFRSLDADPCLVRKDKTILMLYVDDLLVIDDSLQAIDHVKSLLTQEFNMKDMGPVTYYLGIRVVRDENASSISLIQDTYVRKLLTQYGMDNSKPMETPMEPHLHQKIDLGQTDLHLIDRYQSIVGSLLFLAVQTRPDLAFAVGWLARYCHKPTRQHWSATKRVLRYLQGSANRGITYSRTGDLQAYSDASYAEDPIDRKSTSAYIFMLGGGPISWQSKRQELVTTSTTEAEYIGYSKAAKETAWIRSLLNELGYTAPQPTTLYVDNSSSIALAENNIYRARTKHIDVQYHYVRQEIRRDHIRLEYLPTGQMLADGLTKPLNRTLFKRFVDGMNLLDVNVEKTGTLQA